MLVVFQIERHREAVLSQVAETARALRLTVDREIAVRTTALLVLSGSVSLAEGDFERFRRSAAAATVHTGPMHEITLADASGQAVISTAMPFGTKVPPVAVETGFKRVFESRQPFVSDVFADPGTSVFMYAISVPVIVGDTVKYALVKKLKPDAMTSILTDQKLPPGWIAGVFDRRGTVAGRSTGAERFVGKPAAPALVEGLKRTAEGSAQMPTLEGVEVVSNWNRSPATGWTVAVAVPAALFVQLWRDDLIYFGLPALFLLLLSVLFAWAVGSRIAAGVHAVAESARSLAKGETPPRIFSRIGEINDIQDALARAAATLAENRAARAAVLSDLKAADARQHVLIGELDHRAKNMLAAVHSIARRSLPPGDATDRLTGRLVALTRAHTALAATAWRGAHLLQLLQAEAAPFEGQVTLQGRDVLLNAKAAQAIALIFHELMMNAVKYGALSVEAGRVSIAWHVVPGEPPRVVFTWTETGGPAVAPPTRRGFGRTLIERSASLELNGDAALDFAPGGVRCEIAIPLYEMEATALEKLELDAVAVAPGAAARPAPAGPGPKRILVVEDEGMVALDIVDALEDAGYAVEGPAGRLAAALELARTALLDAAVLDANLAGQPVFAVADELARRDVPFVFSSGYSDSSHFPPAYKSAPRIQKPFQRADLLRAIAKLLPEEADAHPEKEPVTPGWRARF